MFVSFAKGKEDYSKMSNQVNCTIGYVKDENKAFLKELNLEFQNESFLKRANMKKIDRKCSWKRKEDEK